VVVLRLVQLLRCSSLISCTALQISHDSTRMMPLCYERPPFSSCKVLGRPNNLKILGTSLQSLGNLTKYPAPPPHHLSSSTRVVDELCCGGWPALPSKHSPLVLLAVLMKLRPTHVPLVPIPDFFELLCGGYVFQEPLINLSTAGETANPDSPQPKPSYANAPSLSVL